MAIDYSRGKLWKTTFLYKTNKDLRRRDTGIQPEEEGQ